jgi:hypothetical protein
VVIVESESVPAVYTKAKHRTGDSRSFDSTIPKRGLSYKI